jgi:uncharacterized membrane protein
MLADVSPWVFNVIFPLNRWGHLVACTLLVGGVLFFEFVVPVATEDLKEEQQLAVFGRARWAFRKVFWASVIALAVTGVVLLWRTWALYHADEQQVGEFWLGPRLWVAGHVLLGLLGFALVLRVVHIRRVMPHPVTWMRAAMVVLLVSMFTASVARQVRLRLREWRDLQHQPVDPARYSTF